VTVSADMLAPEDKLPLFNVPGGVKRGEQDQIREIAWLGSRDVALVIYRERTVSGEVYVLGPHGGGWAPSAFLTIAKEPEA